MNSRKLSRRIGYVLIMLFIIAVLNQIPTPGVNRSVLKHLISQNSTLGLINSMSGNAISNVSLLTLSITPYITASIIIQLLEVCIPKITEIRKDGKRGEIIYKRIQYVMAFVLGSLQGFGMATSYSRTGIITGGRKYVLLVAAIWVAGAMLVLAIGESFEKRGVGNGISIILAFNILSSYGSDVLEVYERFFKYHTLPKILLNALICAAIIIGLYMFTVILQSSEKKLTVMYSGKTGGIQTHTIPIKLCPGSVIPVIFASTLFSIPTLILSFVDLNKDGKIYTVLRHANKVLDMQAWFDKDAMVYTLGAVLYVLMIFMFSSFYSNIVFNPIEIADNMRKQGGYIEGVRSGIETEAFLEEQTKYTIRLGAIGLSIIALVPILLSGLLGITKMSFMGTSVIITVGVILETKKAIEAEAHYAVLEKKGIFEEGVILNA